VSIRSSGNVIPAKAGIQTEPGPEARRLLDSRLRAGLSGEIEGELSRQERGPRKNKETSRVLRRPVIVETVKRARKFQTLRCHRGGRASRPSRLRRSLRSASRTLTRARLDGLVQPRRFADRNGRMAGFGSKTSWSPIATPSDRSHPQGRSAAEHPSWRLMGGYRFARTFEAPWRVDGDRAAWRRGVESKSSAPPSAGFPRTALRLRGNDRRFLFAGGA